MGLSASKIGKQVHKDELQEGSVPSTPILTPRSKTNSEYDPRSPSAHISRTPLELLSAVSQKLENLEEIDAAFFHYQTPSKKEEKILGIDPRSPTVDFTRTPIILNAKEAEIPKKLHNKNLEKVRQTEFHANHKHVDKSNQVTTTPVPPKLLESSPLKSHLDKCKRKSLVGLLETNVDFTETDLDEVLRDKCHIGQTTPLTKAFSNILESIDPRSPAIDFQRTPIQIVLKKEIDINTEDAREEGIEKEDSISSEHSEKDIECIDDQEIPMQTELEAENESPEDLLDGIVNPPGICAESENLETIGDSENQTNSAPVSPPNNIFVPPSPIDNVKQSKSAPITPPRVNITANIKELDKKLTDLIYEDEDIVVCPRIVKLKDSVLRSPLRNCNRNEPVKVQKLKVSDKPRKSDYAVSKIPVFRDKVSRDVQCENTPPRNRDNRKVKGRKSHWDNGDNTLYL
ncbi:hypothetical protein JTB14_009595 [Gonioctena quinquepunctata]|nr:hypothetical protein JTB14_009595 [Gonioctena quinquepunctata]